MWIEEQSLWDAMSTLDWGSSEKDKSFKSWLKLSSVILKKRLCWYSSSSRNSWNKVLLIPNLFLLVIHDLTHTVLNLFFLRFLFFVKERYRHCCSTFFIRVHDKMTENSSYSFNLFGKCRQLFTFKYLNQSINWIYLNG